MFVSLHESTILIGCIVSSEPKVLIPGSMTVIEQMWGTEERLILPLKSETKLH